MNARIRFAVSVAAVLLPAMPPAAAAGFPDRPVQLISPYPAGGAADVLARLIGKELGAALGQPVVIVNKPGAGTVVGAQAVASAEANGYTLLLSSNSTFSMNPAVYPKLPYNPAVDFEPIGMVAKLALAIFTQQTTPLADVAQLVAAAKAEPTKYMYASFGNATASHFAAEMFKVAADIQMTHVPYRGSNPAMTDLLGGQVPLSFDTVVAGLPQIKAGKIKALAVTTARRSALLPDVPTIAESGYPGFDMSSWVALVGRRGMPSEAKARLGQALEAVMSRPEVQDKLKSIGFEPAYARMDDWTAFVTNDISRMREVATRSQIRAD